jgi:hypothetical protein
VSGAYSFSIVEAAGIYNYTVIQQVDLTGLTSPEDTQTWVLDTVRPADISLTPFAATTSGNSYVIGGVCETGATVNLGGASTQSAVCAGGSFSFTVTATVDGLYNYTLLQTDLAGNTALTPGRFDWTRNSAVPAAPLITLPASSPYYSKSNTDPSAISGNCIPTYNVNLTGDDTGNQVCTGGGSFSFAVTPPGSDGTYNYSVTQANGGPTSGADTLSWVLDTMAPAQVVKTQPASSPVVTASSSITISGTCESGATVVLSGDDNQNKLCVSSAFSFTVTEQTDGTYTYNLVQTDQAGNTSSPATTQVWQREPVPPAPTISTPSSPQTSQGPPTLSGTCVNGYTVALGGAETGPTDTCSGGAFTLVLSDKGSDGNYSYTVRQWIVSGVLSAPASFTWVRDTTAPSPPTIAQPSTNPNFTTGTTLMVGGVCESGATVNLNGDDSQVTACASSAYSFTITETLEGIYNYALTQTDPAGNTSIPDTNLQWQRFAPGFTVTPTALTGTEGGAPQMFDIALNTPPDGNVVIDITSSDTSEATVSPASLTFNTGNWMSNQTVTVTPEADFVSDGNQSVLIITSVNSGSTTDTTGYKLLNPADVSMTVLDVNAFGITVTPQSGLTTTESGGQATFTIVLNKQPTGNVQVDVASLDSTEVSVSTSSLTFTSSSGSWDVPQMVTITGLPDGIADGNQLVTIKLTVNAASAAEYLSVDPPDVTVTNIDVNSTTATVTPTSGIVISENGGFATFTVFLNAVPTGGNVTVNVQSLDTGEAVVNKSSLLFTASDYDTPQTVTITGVNDAFDDGNQTVTIMLTISAPGTNYEFVNPPDVQILVTDDDTAGFIVTPQNLVTSEPIPPAVLGTSATFSVSLNTRPALGKIVVIDITSLDATEVSVDKPQLTFTDADWATPQVVTVTGLPDPVADVDGNQTVTIALAIDTTLTTDDDPATGYKRLPALNPPDVTVLNSDVDFADVTVTPTSLTVSESGTSATFSVRPNTTPDTKVVILVQSQDTTEFTVDKSTLTFTAADWQTPQVVTVTGKSDALTDGNITAKVALILDTVETDDADYLGPPPVDPDDVTVTNLDNTPGVTFNPTSGLNTTEAGGTATFTVRLNTQPGTSNPIVIDLTSSDTNEVTVSPAQLTFDDVDWSTPQTVTLTGVDDMISDPSKIVDIDLAITTADPGYNGLGPYTVQVTNSGDVKEVIVSPTTGLVTSESGSTDTFSVSLSALPSGNVVINVVSLTPAEVTVNKATLTFTTSDWMTPQVVTVKGVNDLATDGDQLVTIQITMNGSTADGAYGALDPTDPTVTNLDNEASSEGTTGAPKELTLADLPHQGQVAGNATSNSYYHLTGLDPAKTYYLSVSSLTGPMYFYVNIEGTWVNPGANCDGEDWGSSSNRPRHCVLQPDGDGELYIEVTSLSGTAGRNFLLNVKEPLPANEGFPGSPPTPLNVTGMLPYQGEVGDFDNAVHSSYYVVNITPAPGKKLVRITDFTDEADLWVYSSADFSSGFQCSSTASGIAESCVTLDLSAVSALYIRVDAIQNPSGHDGTRFVLDIVDPPISEGSPGSPPTPKELTGLLPYSGTLGPNPPNTDSFYMVDGLTPGSPYTVSITNVTGGGTLQAYNDAAFTNTTGITCNTGAANSPETCVTTANGSAKIYFKVTRSGAQPGGSTYDIRVQ